MERRHGAGQTGLAGHDGGTAAGDADGYDRLASGNRYGYDQLLLLDQVLDESDFTRDLRLFKNWLKRLQICRKEQAGQNPCRGSI